MASVTDVALIIVFILMLLAFIIMVGALASLSFQALNFAAMDEEYSRHQRWK